MKFLTFLFVILTYLCTTITAQQRAIINRYGDIKLVDGTVEEIKQMIKTDPEIQKHINPTVSFSDELEDTIDFNNEFSVLEYPVYIKPLEHIYQFYKAPVDVRLVSVGFLTIHNQSTFSGSTAGEIKLVKPNWNLDQFLSFERSTRFGYYPVDGVELFYTTAFQEDPLTTGDWVSVNTEFPDPPFGEDVWALDGYGATVPVVEDELTWVDFHWLFEPEFDKNECFGVSVKNVSGYDPEAYPSMFFGLRAYPDYSSAAMKFYCFGRVDAIDPGWWIQPGYVWDFVFIVNILGNIPPKIENVTQLETTLSADAQQVHTTVTDPDDGNATGIQSVQLFYSTNDEDYIPITMISSGDEYTASIPYQSKGTNVSYFIKAIDVDANETISKTYHFSFFQPTCENMLVFNGYRKPNGYPQDYYFGHDDLENETPIQWEHDILYNAPLTDSLLSSYKNVIEITTRGPIFDNREVIRNWLEDSPDHNYMRAGDEWSDYGWHLSGSFFEEGSFEYDVLGISRFKDSRIDPGIDTTPMILNEDSMLGAALLEKMQSLVDAGYNIEEFIYHPSFTVNYLNSIDIVLFNTEVDTIFRINYNGILSVAYSRVLPTGNKIVYFTFDPLSLRSKPDSYWFGFSESAPHVEALKWFGIDVVTTTKSEDDKIAAEYKLYQNYPNPFNPTTTIKYSIPNTVGDENLPAGRQGVRPLLTITMKIYDILGREVRALVNEKQKPGNYEIEFDGSEFASGVYFYQLRSGEFIDTKKFVLLK